VGTLSTKVSLLSKVSVTRCFCEKINQWPQKWPKQSPNQSYSTKILPKSLVNFFLEKNLPMLKNFCQNGKNFPNLVTLTFDERVTFVESVLTKRPGSWCETASRTDVASKWNCLTVIFYLWANWANSDDQRWVVWLLKILLHLMQTS
jgi:hypothetical protein